MLNENQIELKNDKVNEILEKPDTWTIKWGGYVAVFSLGILFLIAFFIKYPDVLISRIVITSTTLPKEIKVNSNAKMNKISKLFVRDNQFVKKDQILGVVDNAANYEDIVLVKQQFQDFNFFLNHKDITHLDSFSFFNNVQLGDMQPAYFNLAVAIENYKIYMKYKFHKLTIESISSQVTTYQKLKESLYKEKKIIEQQYELSRINFQRDSTLNSLDFIANTIFEDQKKKHLDEKIKLEKIESELLNIDLFIGQKNEAMLYVLSDSIKTKNSLISIINQTRAEFQNQLKKWEDTYLLKSPLNGFASFTQLIQQNLYIQENKSIMVILPIEKSIFAYTYIPSSSSGKIKLNQDVRIRLDAFPFKEYGVINGKIMSISNATFNGNRFVQIQIPNSLETNLHKRLSFSANMQGEGHIITEDLRFIERVFYHIRGLFTNQ